ncbi:hypothetical protein CBM2623_B30086 [Cupriavidus taiwanensis]|nr:hypothetical protein CBM2591_B20085 [Cupriavidus taiwanensis]SOZ29603.1 hypothetical protein CBM2608_B30085 [Cupriavidus taiwanensis]SOZ88124.1 hypothetical protein CBM2618_B40088 [Cupriavidus taiwanensis]SOZ91286.1 hypothetical protein CBM2622_B40085 [Cupriavidus taiwanensis]SOZ95269.1 hypothetical protein CBM2621_B40087 [Cupriavidus taiwanensis]
MSWRRWKGRGLRLSDVGRGVQSYSCLPPPSSASEKHRDVQKSNPWTCDEMPHDSFIDRRGTSAEAALTMLTQYVCATR